MQPLHGYHKSVAPHVVALVEDLFFLVQIKDAAQRSGCTIQFLKSAASIHNTRPDLVVIDLNATKLDPLTAITTAKSMGLEVLAFVPHVQIDLKQQAIEAGADKVVARSNFAQHLRTALENLSATR